MKLFKKVFSLLAVAALCMGFFFSNSLTASAAEPTTYYLKYVSANNQWRYQEGNTWKADGFHRELYYMHEKIKDGDIVIIDSTVNLTLELDVRLSNLTIVSANTAVVYAKGYDNVYVLAGSIAAINGDVANADVYGNAIVNFNNNVGFLRVLDEKGTDLHATINCLGTVDHLYGGSPTQLVYENYSYAKDSLRIVDGANKTDVTKFTSTPPAATTTPSTPATNNNSNNSNNDYDDVPKTGDNGFMNPVLLVAIAAICAFGAYKLKK